MWGEFILALAVGTVLLYGPGFLFFRGLRFSRILSTCCAPLFCICLYAGLPLLYYEVGIPCNLPTIVTPTLLCAALTYLVSRTHGKNRECKLTLRPQRPLRIRDTFLSFDVVIPLIYVLLATVVCACVFIHALPTLDSFVPRNDNQTHLNLTRSFLESGKWSSLHTSPFLASPMSARPHASDGGFYPGAWSSVVALICLASDAKLTVAVNAVVALASSLVFPLGMYAFMRALLPNERRAIMCGAVAVTGFANCPWHYVYTGPLFPNQLGISLQFGALAALIAFLEQPPSRQHLLSFVPFAGVAFVALTLTHPTTIFSSYVFMAFYGSHRILESSLGRRRPLVLAALWCGVIAFWVLCYHMPMLGGVIGYVEKEQAPVTEVLNDLLGLGFRFTYAQLGMVICVTVGCIVSLRKHTLRWLFGPVLFFALGYVASRTDWWTIKHWVAALWYSDKRRMAMNMSLYLMPLAALGLGTLLSPLHATRDNAQGKRRGAIRPQSVASIACLVAVLALVYLPAIKIPDSQSYVRQPLAFASKRLEKRYREGIYSPREVAFVNHALAIIPAESLVLNFPADGSMWSYGVNGLNTFFRFITFDGQTDDAKTIRLRLCDYATDPAVREAVKHVGATYVLLLDKGVSHENGQWIWQFGEDQMAEWAGINSIDDSTPGFTTVLAEGNDLRLYRID